MWQEMSGRGRERKREGEREGGRVARDEGEREGEREGGRERGREGGRKGGREAINKEERELRTYSTTKSLSKFMRVRFTVLQSLEK